jgi:5'(3')-deoxyribonucleotidase
MTTSEKQFVFGVDLDGVCADFFGRMREIAAEWLGKPLDCLTEDVDYNLEKWGLRQDEYEDLHRFAVTQRKLFATVPPINGASQALRHLSNENIRIRIITHRLRISYFHKTAATQTVKWLDRHGFQYWDLCFMRDKGAVGANLYIEDSPSNIQYLHDEGKSVIIFSTSTNRHVQDSLGKRAENWKQVEEIVLQRYKKWK